ncbi:UDP-N-acetylglucosamine pyrophosphorylase /glucosamine-1-phosphate N-acetyltransferase [Microvirgula sp. AG722]|uniref:bifunctional UDP-N-acetylglucosamine diphosphorylase/glucosamine-1-phosphate N-acetyltransferase GlmU n=1 Tax=Microvirgula sp. AG722 TaxID=2183901 RepID=UPI000DC25094|nr:bifunctional UDP-N-acetylglucosamine diphosphorylase/glucosamine-1-phosphate N-acetyltransferase GlmU [Microvirgula sp. AG722]RAS13858.1 UDP-N-acetylglucosamine pyrophosphorylase /glucosamine-1-phosphate N-acetyltransferase [Microvirgula sp. AG722]
MNALSTVILAAGRGKRMYSDLPKVLHPIGGQPMLGRVITTARQLTPDALVVVYGHGGERVRETFAGDSDLRWAEQAQQLGTGHALKMAMPHLPADGQVLVLYGDVPLIQAETLRRLATAAGSGVGLLVDTLDDPTGYGRIVRDAHGRVSGIVEQKDASAAQLAIREINTGILVLPAARLAGWLNELGNDNVQGEYYLTDVIALAVRDDVAVTTLAVPASWQAAGVNAKRQLAELERIFQREQANALLDQGVTLLDPSRFDLRGELQCGRDVSIDVGCVFEGRVTLGDGVHIGAHCVLRNVSLAAGCEVQPFSHLDGASVGEGARIGPYARLRPGAELAGHVHVGNFVEIKKSRVGEGSKVNHLTYIGDSDIGRGVNVGAGTVTCNYDGVNKFRTVVEDNAFIGSGTMLVAPVRIEQGATIGAGSVITRTAPTGALTLARAKQMTLSGWQRPKKP